MDNMIIVKFILYSEGSSKTQREVLGIKLCQLNAIWQKSNENRC